LTLGAPHPFLVFDCQKKKPPLEKGLEVDANLRITRKKPNF
jgi:hypothetical protein